ncbi:hypothetical protein G9P44_005139 [Scheffersomyces stipitis]|nr:hypothetical protein G9P44_005139 [Scheffersomyces stipitis]
MSLKSGIDSEIKWALSTLTRVSLHPTFSLEAIPYFGHELIKYFIKPYQLILEKKPHKVSDEIMAMSLDSLLTLRNSAQDLPNQQWLAQVKPLKKSLVEVSKFLFNWFYHDDFKEALTYLVDLLEPLSCYYIDNSKHDPLFNTLLSAAVLTRDKTQLISLLKCLSHFEESREDERKMINCIDAITESQLEHIVNQLLINDGRLNYAVLEFLKSYLFSEATTAESPNSIRDSQSRRLQRLLQLNSSKSGFNTLVKQLPLFDRFQLAVKRSYKPTTWLRCCYEPYAHNNLISTAGTDATTDVIPGENVSHAFPNSEAMVVNLDSVEEENYKLPIGHIDMEKFAHTINRVSEEILSEGSRVSRSSEAVNSINLSSYDLLDYIINEIVQQSLASDLVYTNPSLLENGLINSSWLKYLI